MKPTKKAPEKKLSPHPSRRQATPEDRFQSKLTNELSKAKAASAYANTELKKINVPTAAGVRMGADSLQRGLQLTGSLGRMAARAVKGEPSYTQLRKMREDADNFVNSAKDRVRSKPPGPNSLTTPRDSKDAPVFKGKTPTGRK